jgi:pyridoxal/pyridoxine/pyridoxamine kinase
MVSVGNKSATKKQMIDWAITAHPNVQMPSYKKNGIVQITEAKAEHMADAIATIHAGVTLPDFQQFLRMTA